MYPIMYKLEDAGFISSEKKQVSKRMSRVYYHIEDSGREHLSKLISDYRFLVNTLNLLIDEPSP